MAATENDVDKVKVLLIGDSAAGKTSLLLRATDNGYRDTFIPTIGVNFKSLELNQNTIYIYDSQPGQAAALSQKIKPDYMIINFDISDRASFDNTKIWFSETRKHEIEGMSIILVGNKSDLDAEGKREVTTEEAKTLADTEECMLYIETSAKEGINCHQLFSEISHDATKRRELAHKDSLHDESSIAFRGKPVFKLDSFRQELKKTQENSTVTQAFKLRFFGGNSSFVKNILEGKDVSYQEIKDYAQKNKLGTVSETLKKFDTSYEEAKLSFSSASPNS